MFARRGMGEFASDYDPLNFTMEAHAIRRMDDGKNISYLYTDYQGDLGDPTARRAYDDIGTTRGYWINSPTELVRDQPAVRRAVDSAA